MGYMEKLYSIYTVQKWQKKINKHMQQIGYMENLIIAEIENLI